MKKMLAIILVSLVLSGCEKNGSQNDLIINNTEEENVVMDENDDYELKIKDAPNFEEFERAISLRIIDSLWVEHLNSMEGLKEGIFLRQYAQTNPLQAYTMEGYNMFEQLLNRIDDTIAQFLLKANIEQNTQRRQVVKGRTNEPSEQEHKKPIKKEKKPGRNDPCSCGSGKKYKNCCGKNA